MLKCLLALAVVIETEFVHRVTADGPGVSNIPLLETLCHNISEARKIGAGEFEVGERVMRAIVVEVVIDAQILLVIQSVVNLGCDLVAAYGRRRHGADQIAAIRRSRNKLEQINRGRIHTSEGNLTTGEDWWKWVSRNESPVRRTILNNSLADSGSG